ncbi:WD repeat-containing protein 65 [Planoprotostelium fungivorum]|uniref:WD repeat-containing protein 65 n=1 Tax=Planoprotostelium fungivorum TaxID=1890364 RepID=A0A2P6MV30_9EUKA|nr:WD repeat-containing protein 65 [Planoprotostelium fungivorum]
MSVTANLLHCFGLKGDVQDNIWYFDDNIAVFPVGDNVVVYDVVRKTQKFINGGAIGGTVEGGTSEPLEGITAMCISPNKRYVAVAEKGTTQAFVSIYDLFTLRKKKVISTRDCGSKHFVCMNFSPDSKYLITQGAEPESGCFFWNWEKQPKPLAFFKPLPASAISQCSFHPNDNSVFCISGNGVFKLYRYIDNNLKLLPGSASSALALAKRDQTQQCLCHAWVAEERIVVGTEGGDLLLFESTGEFKVVLPQSPQDNNSINSIVSYSKGFICGGSAGNIMMYEKTDDKDYYRRTRTIPLISLSVQVAPNPSAGPSLSAGSVHSMAISPSEEHLLVTTTRNQIFALTIPSVLEADTAKPSTGLTRDDTLPISPSGFEYLTTSFHSSSVYGLDVCVRKPLVATCSSDKTVRLWNYKTNSLELVKSFPEDVYAVSMHPSGFHLLIGFSDKLRLMNILMKDLAKVTDFDIRSCREVRFSHGGQFFAAVNGTIVHIFNTYTFENMGNLRGHNGKVKSVFWSPDDLRLVTCGLDGAVYEWLLKDFKRISENVQKTCLYSSAVCLEDSHTIYATGSDKKLKELVDGEVTNSFLSSVSIEQLVLSHSGKILFAGTEKGCIRCYKFPLTGEYQEYLCHSGAVARLRISIDDNYLFSTGEDGSFFMIEIKSKDVKARKVTENQLYADLDQMLIPRSDIEEKNLALDKLKYKFDELSMHHEYQIKLKEMNYVEKMKEMKENFSHQLDQWKIKYESLTTEKADAESESQNKIKEQVEKHKRKIQDIENKYQQQIVEEVERYQMLSKSKEELQALYQQNLSLIQNKHEKAIGETKEAFDQRQKEGQAKIEATRKEIEEARSEFDETKQQKQDYEEKLSAERQQVLRLRGENNLMSKKFHSLNKDIEDLKEQIQTLQDDRKQQDNRNQHLALKKEIKDRDDTLGDKEKRIFELKKRNQELEKFKFVLDYTIKELKKQIEPLNSEITDLKDQIKEMDAELERYHKNSGSLDLTIRDLRLKNEAILKETAAQKKRAVAAESECKRIRSDLHDTMSLIQEPNALKERMKELYRTHVDIQIQEAVIQSDIQLEYNRQREYLEKSVTSLKKQLNKESEKHKADSNKIMQENIALINEINALRRELKSLKQSSKDKELVFITRRDVSSSPDATQAKNLSRAPSSRMSMSARERGEKVSGEEELRMIEMQREEIKRLRKRIIELEAVRSTPHSRPLTRGDPTRNTTDFASG